MISLLITSIFLILSCVLFIQRCSAVMQTSDYIAQQFVDFWQIKFRTNDITEDELSCSGVSQRGYSQSSLPGWLVGSCNVNPNPRASSSSSTSSSVYYYISTWLSRFSSVLLRPQAQRKGIGLDYIIDEMSESTSGFDLFFPRHELRMDKAKIDHVFSSLLSGYIRRLQPGAWITITIQVIETEIAASSGHSHSKNWLETNKDRSISYS